MSCVMLSGLMSTAESMFGAAVEAAKPKVPLTPSCKLSFMIKEISLDKYTVYFIRTALAPSKIDFHLLPGVFVMFLF